MENPKILYPCNHVIDELDIRVVRTDVIKTSSPDGDVVCDTNNVIRDVNSISQYDGTANNWTFYHEGIDFQKVIPNMIKWISSNTPAVGSTYTIEYERINRQLIEYEQEQCPRCMSNGWYISIIDNNQSTIKKTTGINKLVQDFMKILLTDKDLSADSYGSKIMSYIGKEVVNPNDFALNISSAVLECEIQYKKIQADLLAKGFIIDNSELLKTVIVTDCEYDEDFKSVFLTVILVNQDSKKAEIDLKL